MITKSQQDDLNDAINLVYERTGLVPEVETATELANALLEWGEDLAAENAELREKEPTHWFPVVRNHYLGGIRIFLPKCATKFLLNYSQHPIFYFFGTNLKPFGLPWTIVALIDAPLFSPDPTRPLNPWIDLRVAFGAKRANRLRASILRNAPLPDNLIDRHLRWQIRKVVGFTRFRRSSSSNQNAADNNEPDRQHCQQNDQPIRDRSRPKEEP